MWRSGRHRIAFFQRGNYTVILNATNADGSDSRVNPTFITVNPNQSFPNFTATPRSGKVPLTVQFNDTSYGGLPTLWFWIFGDRTTSALQSPVHVYTAAGNYTVALNATNTDGTGSLTRPAYISVSGAPPTTVPTTAPTTNPTMLPTKPAPKPTKEPLSPLTAVASVGAMCLLHAVTRRK